MEIPSRWSWSGAGRINLDIERGTWSTESMVLSARWKSVAWAVAIVLGVFGCRSVTVIDTEYIGGAGPNGMVGEDVTAGPNPSSLNDGCKVSHEPGCDYCKCEACVCQKDSWCCEVEWSEVCVKICDEDCGGCGFSYTCGNVTVHLG